MKSNLSAGFDNKRLVWLDIAKGIGILLVVLGHCLHINEKYFQLIFVFHMPLFFALSGYVFKGSDSFWLFLKKKAKTLLLPFLGFFLLGLIVTLLVPVWKQGLSLAGLKNDLWLADPNAVHNSSIWYLVCLFFVALLFYFISKLPAPVQFLCLLLSYVLGIRYSRQPFVFMGYARLPLNFDVLPVAVVFYALGHYAKTSNAIALLSQKRWIAFLTAILGSVGVYILWKKNGYVNLHGLNFGASEMYLLGGCAGTLAVVGISSWISEIRCNAFRWLKLVLAWYGRHSLTILGLQSLLIRLYIIAMAKFFGISLHLYQFPMQHTLLCTGLVAFVICPAVCLLFDFMKHLKIRKKHNV